MAVVCNTHRSHVSLSSAAEQQVKVECDYWTEVFSSCWGVSVGHSGEFVLRAGGRFWVSASHCYHANEGGQRSEEAFRVVIRLCMTCQPQEALMKH